MQATPPRPHLEQALVLGLPLIVLVLAQGLLAWQGVLPVLDGELGDPDAYMRLNRVRQLYESGSWFDALEPRIGPPDGHLQHWTRPLDVVLLGGTIPLVPIFGFATALYIVGVLFAPLCLAGQLVALNWTTRPILSPQARLVAGLLLLLQPTLVAYSSLGRPDHHAPLLLLASVVLGASIRLVSNSPPRALPAVTGALGALAIWISPEAITFVLIPLLTLGLRWLSGARPALVQLATLAGWLALGLAIGMVIERGFAGAVMIEPDRLSLAHLLPVTLTASLLVGLVRLERVRPQGPSARLLWVVFVPLAVASVTLGLFPGLATGPFGPVDPLYRTLRLEQIVEIQPLLRSDLIAAGRMGEVVSRALMIVGLALIAVPVVLSRIRDPRWLPVIIGLTVFLPLTVYQVRWSAYAQILLVVTYAPWIVGLGQRLGKPLPPSVKRPARLLVLMIGMFWPAALAQALPQTSVRTAGAVCSLRALAPTLNELGDGQPGTILALADLGPELLYRTPHAVLSIPNHRPQHGFNATQRALTATDPDRARTILEGAGVDWLLLCLGPVERRFFAGAGNSLYDRLKAGSPPAWLRPIPFPGDRSTARLFEVTGANP